MKTLKKYAMALVALAIAATSLTVMSFENRYETEQWFPVDSNGDIDPNPLAGEPTDNCEIDYPSETCAVLLPSDHTNQNISEVPTAPKAGRTD